MGTRDRSFWCLTTQQKKGESKLQNEKWLDCLLHCITSHCCHDEHQLAQRFYHSCHTSIRFCLFLLSNEFQEDRRFQTFLEVHPCLTHSGTNGRSEGQSVEKSQCIGKWNLSGTLGGFIPQLMFLNIACGMQIKSACTTLWHFLEGLTWRVLPNGTATLTFEYPPCLICSYGE